MSQRRGTVLFLSQDASRTGAPIFLLRFLRWLRQNRDIKFQILTGRSGALSADFEALAAVDLFEPRRTLLYRILRRLKLDAWHLYKHRSRLRERLGRSDIVLVYANSVASAEMVDFLSFLACPVICHVHELEGVIDALGPATMHLLEKQASQYVAVSYDVKRNLVEQHGIPAEKVQVIHGFIPLADNLDIDASRFRDSIRNELGIPKEAMIVCGCGSIEPRKGTDLFLRVAEQVTQRFTAHPVHFVWVGDGPARTKCMQSYAASPVLRDAVHFVGRKQDVVPYFCASDIFLLTSREDPFPLVMLEAAQCHSPVICFDKSGGAPEFVERDAGFVIPDFDVSQMADKVVQLLSSPSLCQQMGKVARQKVLSRYSISIGATTIAALIEGAMLNRRHGDVSVLAD